MLVWILFLIPHVSLTSIIYDCNVDNVNVNVNDTQQNSAPVSTDELNDDVIAQGDEHNLSITGGPGM